MKNIEITNLPISESFTGIVYYPCKVSKSGTILTPRQIEQCPKNEAEFWGVYTEAQFDCYRELNWIADCENEEDAKNLVSVFTSLGEKMQKGVLVVA